jgi:hypothetical protein
MSIAAADVNGDGHLDLVLAHVCSNTGSCNGSSGTVGVLLGNGDGTFQTAVSYGSDGLHARWVAVADVNGDAKPDLVVANQCDDSNCDNDGTVGVLLGNGDGTFQTAVAYDSGGYGNLSVAVADLNGDGKPDIVVSDPCPTGSKCDNASSKAVGILLGNGDGTFQPAVTYGTSGFYSFRLAVADVNGDHIPDLLVANYCSDSSCANDASVSVLLGNGDGTFSTAVAYDAGGDQTYSVAVGDVNGDGKPDLVVANILACSSCSNGTVGVLLGNGDGTFQKVMTYDSGGNQAISVVLQDVNADGKLDVVVANYCGSSICYNVGHGTIGVLLGNGDGTFQTASVWDAGDYDTQAVAVGDVNGDGKPDLLASNQCTDSNCNGEGTAGVLINLTVTATTTALVSSPNPSSFSQLVTLTATVTPQGPGTPTGTVKFSDGTTTLGTSSLNSSGVASLAVGTLSVGTHSTLTRRTAATRPLVPARHLF